MNRKAPIMVAITLLLGAAAIPGVSVRSAAAAGLGERICHAAGGEYSHGVCQSTTDQAAAWKAECAPGHRPKGMSRSLEAAPSGSTALSQRVQAALGGMI